MRHSSIAKYQEIIELEALQILFDLDFVLTIPLIEQQLYNAYHLFLIPVYDDKTGLHHILSIKNTLRPMMIL